jgi:Malectin domain
VNGVVWSADQYFASGGKLVTCPTSGTNDNIYCSSRFFRSTFGTPFRYDIPISQNGSYTLKLHFAEQYVSRNNRRKFDVTVEGILAVDDLDIFATAPGQNAPLVISIATTVTDGSLTIDFITGTVNYPQINGIEVLSLGPPVDVPTLAPVPLVPTATPVSLAPNAVPVSAPTSSTFQDILINCGGKLFFCFGNLDNDFLVIPI